MANRTLDVELVAPDRNTLERKLEHYWVMFCPLGYDTRLAKPAYYDPDRRCWVAEIKRLESSE